MTNNENGNSRRLGLMLKTSLKIHWLSRKDEERRKFAGEHTDIGGLSSDLGTFAIVLFNLACLVFYVIPVTIISCRTSLSMASYVSFTVPLGP